MFLKQIYLYKFRKGFLFNINKVDLLLNECSSEDIEYVDKKGNTCLMNYLLNLESIEQINIIDKIIKSPKCSYRLLNQINNDNNNCFYYLINKIKLMKQLLSHSLLSNVEITNKIKNILLNVINHENCSYNLLYYHAQKYDSSLLQISQFSTELMYEIIGVICDHKFADYELFEKCDENGNTFLMNMMNKQVFNPMTIKNILDNIFMTQQMFEKINNKKYNLFTYSCTNYHNHIISSILMKHNKFTQEMFEQKTHENNNGLILSCLYEKTNLINQIINHKMFNKKMFKSCNGNLNCLSIALNKRNFEIANLLMEHEYMTSKRLHKFIKNVDTFVIFPYMMSLPDDSKIRTLFCSALCCRINNTSFDFEFLKTKLLSGKKLFSVEQQLFFLMKLPEFDNYECCICYENKTKVIFNCGHCTCHKCCLQIDKCPMCNSTIQNRIICYC